MDPQGAVVADVKVTLVNEATGVARSTLANAAGEYVFSTVEPATYTETAESPGFKKFERKHVIVATQEFLKIGINMEIGSVSDTVMVTGEVALIENAKATRPWRENAATIALARAHGRPLISGGDRHACEPNGNLNLTNAQSFSEFVGEIRERSSTLLFMPQYREPLGLRILEAGWDILRRYRSTPAGSGGSIGFSIAVKMAWHGPCPPSGKTACRGC